MSNHLADMMDNLGRQLADMNAMVVESVQQACQSVRDLDVAMAQRVVALDERIDEAEVKVEQSAIAVLALHQPAAVVLRIVTSTIKANADFERIADNAVNIAQRVPWLAKTDGYKIPPDLELMANTVLAMLRDTVQACNQRDDVLAGHVRRSDDVVDALYHQIVQDMIGRMEADGYNANIDLNNIMIAKNLERIGDHCTNIAEDVIYMRTGKIMRHLGSGGKV